MTDVHEPRNFSEFLSACRAKRNPERFVAIAYFLKKYRNRMSFDKNDLVDGFEEAGEQFPANFSRDFKCVKNAGWIALKYGRRGTFYVTKSGHSAVEAKFPSAPRQKGHKMKGLGNNNGTGDAETIGHVTEVETE